VTNRINAVLLFHLLVFILATSAFADCSVTTTPVSFGNYDTAVPTPLDSTGSINISCDKTQGPPPSVTVSISVSSNSGVFIPRQMKHFSRSDVLNYNLYTKQNRTTVWGDGSGGTSSVQVQGTNQRKVTIYATIPPQQNVHSGLYTDTLTVTITW